MIVFLSLSTVSTPACDAFSFSPGSSSRSRLQHPTHSSVRLFTSNQVEDAGIEGWRKMTGGAAAFFTGMGIMAQVAFADPGGVASIDTGEFDGIWAADRHDVPCCHH